MALRYSEGLLSGLRNFGQSPTRQVNQTLAQPVDTSQALAASLGGLFGVDMRSPQAVAQEQARQVYSQALSASPEKQLELASQLMNISGYESAAMQLAQQAQAKLEQGQKQLEKGQEEISSSLNQTRREQSLALAIQEKNPELASLIRQGDPDAYKRGVALLSPKEKTAKDSDLRFDVVERVIDGQAYKVQVGTDKQTGQVVSENVIGDVVADDKEYKSFLETTAGSAAYNEAKNKKKEHLGKAQTLSSLISTAQSLNDERKGGVFGRFREFAVTDIAGLGDEFSVFRADLNKLRMEQALDLLPKGPASDRDVALALDASINPNDLKGETLISYLRGMEKVNKAAQEYYSAQEEYIAQTEDANAIGFEQWAGIVAQERQLEAETSKNPAVVGEIMNILTEAANADSPEKQQAMFNYAREVQQELTAQGLLDADILGIIEERGRLQSLFDDVKKRKNITSFRGY